MGEDLISRKEAYKAFSDYLNRNIIGEISSRTELSIGEIASVIKSIPTAFDKEKVIEEIKNQLELSETYNYESDNPTESAYYNGRALGHEIDIKIVEKGGIE